MNVEHWFLITLWILYCLLHSFLADIRVKHLIQNIMGNSFKFYRLSYSLFASVTLIGILWYQFTIKSIYLFSEANILFAVAMILIIPGLIVMIICIKKYFYELSGIQAFKKDEPHVTLQQKGLHNYIRHPLYAGTLLFVWGLFLLFPLLSNIIACVIITLYVLVGIRLEEKQLLIEFGESYKEYSKNIPMLIPDFWAKSKK